MFTGKAQTLSRVLQVVFIVSFIVIVFFMMFDRGEIEVGKTYDVIEGSIIAQSAEDLEKLDNARRTPQFKALSEQLSIERAPKSLHVLVIDRIAKVCQIESEQLKGFTSCESILK
ncbi:hypothetical protein ACFSTH_17370 [Paenibacillus yanchengensis]|uniref:Uncharacterized protein n=1 Tax=Paenibacillus yanchengensis TaxID=2035833 RepID=A0ABW4YQN3_9BACL